MKTTKRLVSKARAQESYGINANWHWKPQRLCIISLVAVDALLGMHVGTGMLLRNNVSNLPNKLSHWNADARQLATESIEEASDIFLLLESNSCGAIKAINASTLTPSPNVSTTTDQEQSMSESLTTPANREHTIRNVLANASGEFVNAIGSPCESAMNSAPCSGAILFQDVPARTLEIW